MKPSVPAFTRRADAPLWDAIARGCVEDLAAALKKGADPDGIHSASSPPLVEVVRTWGQSPQALALLDVLLAAGASVDGRDASGCTALSYTAVRLRGGHRGEPHHVSGFRPRGQAGSAFFTAGLEIALDASAGLEWSALCAVEAMKRLLDAGAALYVPMGHARDDEHDRLAPWGLPGPRTLAITVFHALMTADDRAATPTTDWLHTVRIIPRLDRADLEHPLAVGETPVLHALCRGAEAAVLALLSRGVSTELPPRWCAGHPTIDPDLGLEGLARTRCPHLASVFERLRAEN